MPSIIKADATIEKHSDIFNFLKARYRKANVDNLANASVSHIGRMGSKLRVKGVIKK